MVLQGASGRQKLYGIFLISRSEIDFECFTTALRATAKNRRALCRMLSVRIIVAKRTTYKRITKRSRDLLASGEGKYVDYKESVKGVHADDFVAFANSPEGGALLIGVEEITGANGVQRGRPIGCTVDDKARLQIMGKALSCSPAVQIELFIENTDGNGQLVGLKSEKLLDSDVKKIHKNKDSLISMDQVDLRGWLSRNLQEYNNALCKLKKVRYSIIESYKI